MATSRLVIGYRLAALFTLLAAVMGAVVSATESGAACPTWPGCFPDAVTPPAAVGPVIEFSHRVVAITAGLLMLAAGLLGWRAVRERRAVRVLPWVALAGAGVAAAVGRLVVLSSVPAALGALDLFCALGSMVAMGVAAAWAGRPASSGARRGRDDHGDVRRQRGAACAAVATGVLLVLHPLGILVAGPGSHTGTMGWPVWELVPGDLHPWLQVARLALAAVAALLVVLVVVLPARSPLRWAGAALVVLLAAELALGAVLQAGSGPHAGVLVAHAVVAVLLVWGLAVTAASGARLTEEGSRRDV